MFKFANRGVAAFLIFFATLASAVASQWTVVNVKQPTYYSHAGKQWQPVRRGMKLNNGTWINTKRGARVLLKRGGDTILINANSLTGITGTRGKNGRIKMRHRKGDVELSIKPGRKGRVRVITPHVSAVVKGTVFNVSTNRHGSTVSVSRGLVAVSDDRSGESANVSAGQSVSASASVSGLIAKTSPKPRKFLRRNKFKTKANVSNHSNETQIAGNSNSAGGNGKGKKAGGKGKDNKADGKGKGKNGGGNGNNAGGNQNHNDNDDDDDDDD